MITKPPNESTPNTHHTLPKGPLTSIMHPGEISLSAWDPCVFFFVCFGSTVMWTFVTHDLAYNDMLRKTCQHIHLTISHAERVRGNTGPGYLLPWPCSVRSPNATQTWEYLPITIMIMMTTIKLNWGVPATVTVLRLSVFVADCEGAVIVAFL